MPRAQLAYEHWQREQAGEPEKVLVNLYGEVDRSNPKRDKRLVSTPGTVDKDPSNVITGNIRGMAQADAFASGKVLILDGTTLRTWVPSSGTFGTISGTVSGSDRADMAISETELAILSGGTIYVSGGSSIAAVTDVDFPSTVTSVAVMSQRLLFTSSDGQFWFTSVLNFDDITGTNFYTAEAAPDGLLAVRVWAEMALMFGTKTVEMWYSEPSNADDPFSRSTSVVPVGCKARDTIAITSKGPVWVDPENNVVALSGADAPVISPPWLSRLVSAVDAADLIAATYKAEGQEFYCLNAPDWCAVMNIVSGEWHMRESVTLNEGSVAATLAGPTLVATGKLALSGSVDATLPGPTLVASGGVLIQGAVNATLAAPTLVSTIVLTPDNTGTLDATLDGPSLVATGALAIAGTVDATLTGPTLVATGELGGYDSDAQAFIDAMGTTPNTAVQDAIDALVTGLKTDGIWASLDALWPLNMPTLADSLLNLKDPTGTAATAVNSPTHTPYVGIAGNGTSSYINTNWAPSTEGVNFTQNDAFIGLWLAGGADTNGTLLASMGVYDGTSYTNIKPWAVFGGMRASVNEATSSTNFTVSPASRLGLTTIERTAASATEGYRDGSSVGTATTTSNGLPTKDIYLGCQNDNGTASGFINNQMSCAVVGGSLGSTKQAALYSRLSTFRTAMAAAAP